MIAVETLDERLSKFPKPNLQIMDDIHFADNDCLVACAGFEDRASAILERALFQKSRFRVLLVHYAPSLSQNRASYIDDLCRRANIPVANFVYDRQNPSGLGEAIVREATSFADRLFIDISAMSRLLIVQIIVALRQCVRPFHQAHVVYAQAKNYPPSREEADKEFTKSEIDPTLSVMFLSSGVFEVTVVPELSSSAMASGQSRLIGFPTLDADQMTALRTEIQPFRYTFIQGIPPSQENSWRTELIKRINKLDQLPDVDWVWTSTLDYKETLDCLLQVYREHGIRDRLLISPTGSKMQTVAAGLFRAFLDDIQVVYPTPHSFRSPEKYTTGIGTLHCLPLEPFSRV